MTTPAPADPDPRLNDESEQQPPSAIASPLRLPFTLLGLSLLMMTVILNVTAITSALPTIALDLHINSIQAFWVGTSSLICSTAFQPVYGSLSSIFGRKPALMLAITFLTTGTIICSRASNVTTLLTGRTIQGLGAGGITNLSEVILTDLVPLRLRGRYLAILNSTWAIGSTSGPVIGAAFAQKVAWRWIFYMHLPLLAVGSGLILIFTNFPPPAHCRLGRRGDIDYGGILLFTGGITCVLIPVTWGGVMYPWASWKTLTPLLVGAATLLSFVAYEAYVAVKPMIPLTIFRTRTLLISYIGTATHGLLLSCGLYYLPFYFQGVKGYTPIISGVAMFPVTFTIIPGAMVTGILISRTGKYRPVIWVGWVTATVGLGCTCVIHVDTQNVVWIVCLIVVGIGIGMLFSALNLAVLAAAGPHGEQAAAATMFTFFRALGQTLGVALGGTIFANRVRVNLMQMQPALQSSADQAIDPLSLFQLVGQGPDPITLEQARTIYVDSLRIVWAFCCGVCGVAGLLSLAMRSYPLAKRYPTQQQQQPPSGADDFGESRQDLIAMTRLESVKDQPSVVSFHGLEQSVA
ncbi:hypothetical protein AtubIFM54640_002297 [Aspergillus tubingensis]|uniref:MFS transporter, putative n=1 Tax=Aspergillus niger TaxID=5061 RepID=A0A100I5V9_ASPNG|nr:MFS transporter, putative [Aspergillus niger]GLA61766.1 hypothetical protein AtubIFM54640_002297 [Aspergillus tubingensis]